MAFAPTLTVATDFNPSPRVLVTFASLAPTTQTITVTRVTEGRSYKVRGGVNLFAVGGVAVMDYEPGLATPNSYRAEMFTAAGLSLGFTDASSATIPASVMSMVSQVVISQPLKPTLAVSVKMLADTASTIAAPAPGEIFYPEGATVGVRIGGQRRGLTGMVLSITTDSTADADEFLSMFGGYVSDFPSIVCIRSVPPIRIPRVLFASVTDLVEIGNRGVGPVRFSMTVDEVQPPAPGLVIPTLRRDDIDIAFATRAARAAAYATRLQRDNDYSKAGLAG